MTRNIVHIAALLLFILGKAIAQPVYNMSNMTVSDCKGKLLDSEMGQAAGSYDHNENYTFTICVPGATSISLSFASFCTEPMLDTIRFFDGPTTASPKIGGTYSGTANPGTITASSGCLTIHFKSDEDVACSGWEANWTTDVPDPVPPDIILIGNAFCETTTLGIKLDTMIGCSGISTGDFSISGTGAPVILSADTINCVNGKTDSILLTLNAPLDNNGNYLLNFVYRVLDECDSLWTFPISKSFSITDCPLRVKCIADRQVICENDCVVLNAEASGGDSATWIFQWSPLLPPTAGPHTVCPAVTTTYQVILSDAMGSIPDTDMVTITVLPVPDAGNDTSVCKNSDPFMLLASGPGGTWQGTGITDSLGIFDPGIAGPGVYDLVYSLNNCTDTLKMTVLEINAGKDLSACQGTPPFLLNGQPAGGIWSGSVYVNPAGIFNPAVSGTYKLAYTAGGCTDSMTLIVGNLQLSPMDSACQNYFYQLSALPPFGTWSGPGITGADSGYFQPAVSGPHQLIYTIQGCQDTLNVFVKPINAGADQYACPLEPPFTLSGFPAGGTWSGKAIVSAGTGLFDPGKFGGSNFTDTITYTYDGCTDSRIIYVVLTEIDTDTLPVCESDPVLDLSLSGYAPDNGTWSGNGIANPVYPGSFDPAVTGPGVHRLLYSANNCTDSLFIRVYPKAIPSPDTNVCEGSAAFQLNGSPSGGSWSGPGVSPSGLFDPAQAGAHLLTYTSAAGCAASMTVTVDQNPVAAITSFDTLFCSKDQPVSLTAVPAGGVFSGPGINGSTFNPSQAGAGYHTIYYTTANGSCISKDSLYVHVLNPLQATLQASMDTLCYGEAVSLHVTVQGGLYPYTYTWNNSLESKADQLLHPPVTTTYTVTISDGCSDPVMQSLTVFVHPEILFSVLTSDTVCFGEDGYAKVIPEPGRTYAFKWNSSPPSFSDSLYGIADDYPIRITDLVSGCSLDTIIRIPRYSVVKAFFTPNPKMESCYSISEASVSFIDLSEGGISGTWDFGDGQGLPYQFGINPVHSYSDTGAYEISLSLYNEAGCLSTYKLGICIEPRSEIFAATAFTPNDDGINDKFYIVPLGATDFSFSVFDRWGARLFHTNDPAPDKGWDGRHNGQLCLPGAYIYYVSYKDFITKKLKSQAGKVILAQ